MLILPLHRKPSRDQLPVLTIILVLVNVLVFALLQSGDEEIERAAAQRYVEREIFAQEWRWFRDWAQSQPDSGARVEALDQRLPDPGQNIDADVLRFMVIEGQPEFSQAVRNEWFAESGTDAYHRWQSARESLAADRETSFTRRHMLSYDGIGASTLFSHMFMHGGLMHLVGNMLFLVLLGILLEPALGALRLGLAYLVGGVVAAGFSLAVHWGEGSGMVGASGAIAGMMGLLALVYGMRRIRFFYWVFVYFDYVRAPALVLLPLWLGWEVFAFVVDEGSNIAYEAHIGGILSGALMGLVFVRTGQVRSDWLEELDAEEALEQDRQAVTAAQSSLDALDAPGAKRRLRPLLARHGHEPELLRLYLAACQLRRDDPDLHDAARRIFELPGDSEAERELVVDAFNRYLGANGGRLRIRAGLAIELAGRFIDWNRLAEARALIDRLLRIDKPVPRLAELCGRLSERLAGGGEEGAPADRYRKLAAALTEPKRSE